MKDTNLLHPATDELPQLWQKPTYAELLACLEKFRVQPRVWNQHDPRPRAVEEQPTTAHDRREIVSFLSAVVSSSLAWLDSDDEREVIWEEASRRMSERCGRTAMGEITRQWPFEDHGGGAFSLTIREPPLTGDSLGHKTWGSSYALARRLHELAAGPLAHLFIPGTLPTPPEEVLELGSGTGLLGLAAACIWKTSVALTDLPAIVPNLGHNAALNADVVAACGGSVQVAPLTWGGSAEDTDPMFRKLNNYQLIIVADPLYDDDHPTLLASAIDEQLVLNTDARALVMVPQRDETTKGLLTALRETLAQRAVPLRCLEEDVVDGQDDWGSEHDDDDDEDGDGDGDAQNVGFWWGIFGRDQTASLQNS